VKLLDLFSGIGGFSLGLERAGFETVAFCEVSLVCRHLLATHWPEVRAYDDVKTLTADQLRADGIVVDAICGGFPCQDLSFAGKGAGLAGARSGLWSEFSRLIRELRPRVVIVENVSALLSRGLGVVLGDLATSGYDAEWDCIPASAVGAPHRRDRLWIVAYARSEQHKSFGDAFRRALAAQLSSSALADSTNYGSGLWEQFEECHEGSRYVAHSAWFQRGRSEQRPERERIGPGRESVGIGWQWLTEPAVGRVAHGVPARVDRLHGLGNAVVPQIPEILGRAIIQAGLAA
jgi:DNA (cytosine-5)-methyltransferase 1